MSSTSSTSQVFALIIGINEYISLDIPNLRGAVNDANPMKSYVSEDLQAPDSHITFLVDESATRSAIISAFKTLIKNDKIKENDTIIIFYSGHGSRMKAPDGWITSDGQIETLLPHDVDSGLIHSIPDRTVKVLLRRLADAKGNNITVMFDRCHSGGLTRDVDNETVRSVGQDEADAGFSHGVVHDTLFTVQAPESPTGNTLGVLAANEVDADFYDASTLKVFLHPDSEQQVERALSLRLVDFSQRKPPVQIQKPNLVRVNSRSLADVDIKLGCNGELHIERLDTRLSNHASRWVCAGENRPDRLPFILDAVAHFNYHLGRLHPLENVKMKLYRLITKGFRVPDTEVGNLPIENEGNLELKLDEEAEYGIKIINNTDYDLFPYLFYFDPSDYSIQLWYSPPSFTMDPPLRRLQGHVTVGYGAGGGDPIEFTLKDGERSDTGFLKLFVSKTCVNMDWIAQESPFGGASRRGPEDLTKNQDFGVWGAWNAAITVVRPDI